MSGESRSIEPKDGRYRALFATASGLTFLLIVLGGTVCMTDSTLGCPDWPGCFGQIVPPLQINAVIEYTHRFVAALTGVSILMAAIAGQRRYRTISWVNRALVVTVILLLAVVVFGAFAVLTGLSRGVAAVDLGSALSVLALVLVITITVFKGKTAGKLSFKDPFARLGLATIAATFCVLVSAVLVAPAGSIIRCLGWPFLSSTPFAPTLNGWAQLVRGVLAGVAILLALALILQAWRTQRDRPGVVPAAFVMGAFLVIEVGMGWLIAAGNSSSFWLIGYVVAAAGQWSALVVTEQLAVMRDQLA